MLVRSRTRHPIGWAPPPGGLLPPLVASSAFAFPRRTPHRLPEPKVHPIWIRRYRIVHPENPMDAGGHHGRPRPLGLRPTSGRSTASPGDDRCLVVRPTISVDHRLGLEVTEGACDECDKTGSRPVLLEAEDGGGPTPSGRGVPGPALPGTGRRDRYALGLALVWISPVVPRDGQTRLVSDRSVPLEIRPSSFRSTPWFGFRREPRTYSG